MGPGAPQLMGFGVCLVPSRSDNGGPAAAPQLSVMEELSPTAAPLAQVGQGLCPPSVTPQLPMAMGQGAHRLWGGLFQDGMDGCEQQEDQNSPDMGDLQPHSTPQPHSDTDGGTECIEATKEPLEGEWAAKAEPTCGAEHEERYGAGTVGLPHISAPEHSGVPGGDTELLQVMPEYYENP